MSYRVSNKFSSKTKKSNNMNNALEYSYNDLKKSQKRYIDGMMEIRSDIASYRIAAECEEADSVLELMKKEVIVEALSEIDDYITDRISASIVSLLDRNARKRWQSITESANTSR